MTESGVKILFVDNFKLDFDNPMSTLYIMKCRKIASSPLVHRICITDTAGLKKAVNTNKYEILLLGQRAVPFYKCNKKFAPIIQSNFQQVLFSCKEITTVSKRFMLLQDTHPKTYGSLPTLAEFINKHRLDLVFTFYENGESRWIRGACPNSKFFHVPHHIDTSIFHPLLLSQHEADRPYDIILYGDIHPTHYPFRKRLFELLLSKKEEYKLKILHVTPPTDSQGKNKVFDPTKCEHGLADKIRSAKFAVATKSKYDYLVAKYMEIAACGTIIMGDMATDGLRLPEFQQNYVKLSSSMKDEEIMQIVTDAVWAYNNSNSNTESTENSTNSTVKFALSRICGNRQKFSQYVVDNFNLDQYLEKLIDCLLKTA
jgi:hypothetical protein